MSPLDPEYYLRVFLIFIRISGLFVSAPFFSQQSFPIKVRVLFAVLLAYVLVGVVEGPLPAGAHTAIGLGAAIMVEALTGLLLGFAAQFVFWAVQFAGEVIGFQLGLSMAQVLDPMNGQPSNPMGRLLTMSLLLVFIVLDGHHHVLHALIRSFELVPLSGAQLHTGGPLLLSWTGGFLSTALQLASPFMVTIFLVDTALGVFARVAPQADLFAISLPLKLLVGFGVFFFYLQYFFPIIPDLVQHMFADLMELIEQLAPI